MKPLTTGLVAVACLWAAKTNLFPTGFILWNPYPGIGLHVYDFVFVLPPLMLWFIWERLASWNTRDV